MIVTRHRHYKLLYVCYVFFSFLNSSSFSYLIIIITITEHGFKRVNWMLQMMVHQVICAWDSGDWNNDISSDKKSLSCDFKDVRYNSWYLHDYQEVDAGSESAVRSIYNRIESNSAAVEGFHVAEPFHVAGFRAVYV